ncbi:MAG: serine/threonine-protein kinase [Polyangiaceae bacterium]
MTESAKAPAAEVDVAAERASILHDLSHLLDEVFALEAWGRMLVEVVRDDAGEPTLANVAVEEVLDEARVDEAFSSSAARAVAKALAKGVEGLLALEGAQLELLHGGTFVRIPPAEGEPAGEPRVAFLAGLIGTPSSVFDAARDAAVASARRKVEALREAWGVGAPGAEVHADMSLGTAELVRGGVVVAIAEQVVLGSFSRAHRSWVWGAHNPSLEPSARARSAALLDAFPERSAWEISTAGFTTDEATAWALAAWVAEPSGLSLTRVDAGGGFVVLGLSGVHGEPTHTLQPELGDASNGGIVVDDEHRLQAAGRHGATILARRYGSRPWAISRYLLPFDRLFPLGTIVDTRYKLERELGRGMMGVVYLARDLDLDRAVAIKFVTTDASTAGDRFKREARALAALKSPHVVSVYAFGQHEGSQFFVMEHVRGVSLEDIIAEHAENGERVPASRAIDIITQVGRGLAAVHAAGIIHRDLKPANILIEDDTGRPVIVDFGIATALSAEQREVAGTPSYMCIEQLTQAPPSPSHDVYSLAVVAFELLTNRLPYEAMSLQDLAKLLVASPAPPPSKFVPELAHLNPVFARALHRENAQRFADVDSFTHALQSIEAQPAEAPRIEVVEEAVPSQPPIRRVFIVDDDDAFHRFARRAVELAFFDTPLEIEVFSDGAVARDAAARSMPDLLLLDFNMPRFDGVSVLTELRADPSGGRVRVIVMTTDIGMRLSQFRFRCLGVRDFVAKPTNMQTLVNTITEVAERSDWELRRPG